jgi:hypothetical protein
MSIAAVVSNEEDIFVEDFVFLDHHKMMFGYDLKFEAAMPTDLNQGGAGTVVCPRHQVNATYLTLSTRFCGTPVVDRECNSCTFEYIHNV